MRYIKVSSEKLKLLSDGVLLQSLRQYQEALEELAGNGSEMASKFTEIVEQHETEAERRGLKV